MRSFYAVIKENAAHIRFTFITGVSKFSKVSIFSGLNNLEDISLTPQFGSICGYTQKEFKQTFVSYLDSGDKVDMDMLKI